MKSGKRIRKTKDTATAIDAHVGARVRLRRTLLGMSQKDLADSVNLTFQQIQKYERGANRIGSGRLYEFSVLLGVPVSFFFDELPAELSGDTKGAKKVGVIGAGSGIAPEVLERRETLDLIRSYYKLEDPTLRKKFIDLLRESARACNATKG